VSSVIQLNHVGFQSVDKNIKFSILIIDYNIIHKNGITLKRMPYFTLIFISADAAGVAVYSTGTGTGTFCPRACHEGRNGEKRYSSSLAVSSALDWVGGQHLVPSLYPRKDSVPVYRRLGEQKIPPPPEFNLRTVQPVASHYTDWAIPAHYSLFVIFKFFVSQPVNRWISCCKLWLTVSVSVSALHLSKPYEDCVEPILNILTLLPPPLLSPQFFICNST
jgi:hypothetical protein